MSSFFDTFQDTSSSGYLNKDDKQVLIDNGISFPITSVKVEDHPEYGERYVCGVTVPSLENEGETEDRLLSFPIGTVESRDRMLEAMSKWLDDPTAEPPVVKLDKVGRSLILRAV